MAVPYKAPVKDIVFGYEVIDSYNVLNKISAFSAVSYTHLRAHETP